MATSSPPAQFKGRELCSLQVERLGYGNNRQGAKFSLVMMDAYLAIYSETCMHAVEYPSHEFLLAPRHREDLPKLLPIMISSRLHKMKAATAQLTSTPNGNYRAAMIFLDKLDFASVTPGRPGIPMKPCHSSSKSSERSDSTIGLSIERFPD